MSGARHWEQDKDSTLYIGQIDERCTDAIIWELMIQAAPVINVHLPKDRVTQLHQGYGFVEFGSETDADYAAKIMNGVRLYGKPIRVNKASADKKSAENGGLGGSQGVGAELFIGNLDAAVDEKIMFETFSRFGTIIGYPKVARDDANLSKGYGFVSYAAFEFSDAAIENLHGQYLMNKEITVQYAYKRDGKGERHGDAAERALASQAKKHGFEAPAPVPPPGNTSVVPAAKVPEVEGAADGMLNTVYPNSVPPRPSPVGGSFGVPPPTAVYNMPMPTATGTIPAISQPPRAYNHSPAQGAPPGTLPARPPPSIVGYGGPPPLAPGMIPGFQNGPPPGAFPPGAYPPGSMPPGSMPPGSMPPGYGAPNGVLPPHGR